MKICFIYVLRDPRDSSIRYVGKTINPDKRLKGHIWESSKTNTHKANWIKSLLSIGLKPTIKVIEECSDNEWEEKEKYYIALYKEQYGKLLTNGTSGGEGGITKPGMKHTAESKKKMSLIKKGKRPSIETCKKMSESNARHFLNKTHSQETKKKMSIARSGVFHSAEAKQKISLATSGENNPSAKDWILRSPTGEMIKIKSLNSWCLENNLTASKIHYATRKNRTDQWTIIP